MAAHTSNQTLGESLRQRRSEMNLSLKEVENATSIRCAYLQAIEAGHISELIAPIYAKGFVKRYASFLGLDGEAVVEGNGHLFRESERHEFSYGIGTLETRETAASGIKRLPNLVLALIIAAGLVGLYYLARLLGLL